MSASDIRRWSAHQEADKTATNRWSVIDDRGYHLAVILDSASEPEGELSEKYARLMAAAPALLDALYQLLCGEYQDTAAVRARRATAYAAIAKATGERP